MKRLQILKNGKIVGEGTVFGNSTQRITCSKVSKGTTLFLEAASGRRPLIMARSVNPDGSSQWNSKVVDMGQINHIATGNTEQTPKKMGAFEKHAAAIHATATARQLGERPMFLAVTAEQNGAKITIGSHYIGNICLLYADESGPMLARKGSFLMGQEGITMDQFTVTGKDAALISNLLGDNGYFQQIAGQGFYLLEVQGDWLEVPLHPGEFLDIEPQRLVAMSSSVSIADVRRLSNNPAVRKAEGAEYNLTLQADVGGGKVILADLPQEWGKPHKK